MSHIYKLIKKEVDKSINMSNQIHNEINNQEIYEKFFKVESGDILVDIGAHIGLFTKKNLDKISKAYLLEPDNLFFKELYKLDHNKVTSYQKGIYFKNVKGTIKSDGNANTVNEEKNGEIELITFKTFLEENKIDKIDFLKIDCEGAEYDIFNEENVQWLKENCKKIAGEFHIHNEFHKKSINYVLNLFEKFNLNYLLTSVDGVILNKDQVLNNLNYYTEIMFYIIRDKDIKINVNFVNGVFCEILSNFNGEYLVDFIDIGTNKILHSSIINNNCWTKCFYEYFINYKIKIIDLKKKEIIFEHNYNAENKNILICIDSKSLGDSIAWFPYIEEFRIKHKCNVICSTFNNNLFKDKYPNIKFIEPGTKVENIYAQYNIGWFYNGENINLYKQPIDPKIQPMQKTASDILGLNYKEIRPLIKIPDKSYLPNERYVCIAIHSTAQAKYWNNPTGWQEVVDYCKLQGYKVVLLSREEDGYMGNVHPKGIEHWKYDKIEDLIWDLYHSSGFIGIGSGLTWLAWALNIPTILISGFSENFTEMQDCYRINTKENACTGCFNNYKLDPSDWHWCPVKKNTPRQYECSKTIKSSQVIEVLEKNIFI